MPFDEYGGADHIKSKPEQDGLVKTGLIRKADILGSSDATYKKFFSGPSEKVTKEQFTLWFGRPKPLIKGSDAHAPAAVGILPRKQDGVELNCWIKSDLTFEGFKQIVYEPIERISISTAPPHPKDQSRIIDSLTIRQAQGWFEDQEIKLGSDLVTVIGGKGSGKTALVDLLAFCGGELDPHRKSFLFQAEKELKGTKLCLKWRDGLSDGEVELLKPLAAPGTSKVRYLSQSFVEALCSYANQAKLEGEIENILFQYIPATDKLGAEGFASLKELKVRSTLLEVEDISAQISKLTAEIAEHKAELASRGDMVRQRDEINKEITELHRNKPKGTTDAERKAADDLKKMNEVKKALEERIEGVEIKINKLGLIGTRAQVMRDTIQRYNSELATLLSAIGQSDILPALSAQFPDGAQAVISARVAELTREVGVLKGDPKFSRPADGPKTLVDIIKEMDELSKQCSAESEKQAEIAKFNELISEKEQVRKALEQKVAEIDKNAARLIDEKQVQRRGLFAGFFKKLDDKRRILDELYQPLNRQNLMVDEGRQIAFYARPKFQMEAFVQAAESIFHGVKSVIRGREGFEHLAENIWDKISGAWPPKDDIAILEALSTLQKIEEGKAPKPIRDQLRQTKSEKDVEDWLYSTSFYDVEYGIKYDETDLDKLSPGKKGVVLLLIYLAVDKDNRPLIVDQPEENLDNRSVYSTLVKFFRKAKQHRQIIVVTHNPNLVVNGDSEQVIVANFERAPSTQPAKIRYLAGSLENSNKLDDSKANVLDKQGVREHVCEVLEGGKDAFAAREQKYGFHH